MEMTPLRRTVLAMLLVAIPWFMVGVFSLAFVMQAHLQEEMRYTVGMKVSILVGALMCIAAMAVCADGVRRNQSNPLLYLFAFSALWFLLEWPAKVLQVMLHL
jgi:hypothetical protein